MFRGPQWGPPPSYKTVGRTEGVSDLGAERAQSFRHHCPTLSTRVSQARAYTFKVKMLVLLLALFLSSYLLVEGRKVGLKAPHALRAAAKRKGPGVRRSPPGSQPFLNSVLAFTRFNCAFPFCPTTALDVCTADERYEVGRPHVIATLIPQTPTADMGFETSTFSCWDNSTRSHYTLAARELAGVPFIQLFTVFISLNGTSGGLLSTVEVKLPGVAPTDLTYTFTHGGLVYAATNGAMLYPIDPTTGVVGNATSLLPPTAQMVDTRAATFDVPSSTFFVNSLGPEEGHYLHTYNVATGVLGAPVGPLPPTPTTDAGPGNSRVDTAVATLPVYRPEGSGGDFKLLEMRTSAVFPWIFMAWMDPVTGNSTEVPLPDE